MKPSLHAATVRGIRIAVTLTICLLYALPFAVLLALAVSDPVGAASGSGGGDNGSFLSLHLGNFPEAARASRMGRAILNSAIIAVFSVSLLVAAASMAAYVIARFPTRAVRIFFALLLGSMMIPGIINTVPLYTMLVRLRGINTYWAMIVVCATNALPFAVFLYTGFVKAVPREIEEAATIDGCSPFTAFRLVVFPYLAPVTASVLILNGIGIWNNYGQAVFFLQARDMKTAPLAVSVFFQQYGAHWNLVAAAAVIALAPAVLVFLASQASFVKGISAGAVKG
ncbi:MAG: carbohydrate ABC transporter permease [Spirochaetota bacterium]